MEQQGDICMAHQRGPDRSWELFRWFSRLIRGRVQIFRTFILCARLPSSPARPIPSRLKKSPSPPPSDGAVLVRALALGICGTDREIIAGHYGWAPPGQQRLIIGHELLGRVEEAPAGCGFAAGDLVVGIVRRPDPVPCPACAAGEWDMCRNGHYTERGIKQRNGYGSEHFRVEPDFRRQGRSGARGSTACCWSRPASSPRPGSRSSASAPAQRPGSRAWRWSPAPARSDCWRR